MRLVRTTINIPSELYRDAKASAARRSQSVSKLIEDAVRAALRADDSGTTELSPLVVFGEGWVRPGIDLADNSALLDVLDEGSSLDALR